MSACTSKPERWGKPAAALLGALTAQLGPRSARPSAARTACPAPLKTLDVPPTLVSFAVTMTKASKTISGAFQERRQLRRAAADSGGQGNRAARIGRALKAYYKQRTRNNRGRLCSFRTRRQGRRRGCCRCEDVRSATSSASSSRRLPKTQSCFLPRRLAHSSWKFRQMR